MKTETKITLLSVFSFLCVLTILFQGYHTWNMSKELKQDQSHNTALSSQSSFPFSSAYAAGNSQSKDDPWAQMEKIQKNMDKMMDSLMASNANLDPSFFDHTFFGKEQGWDNFFSGKGELSEVEMKDNKDNYTVTVNVPTGEQVSLDTEIHNNVLTVSGNFSSEKKNTKGSRFAGHSISMEEFSQSIQFPSPVDENGLKVKQEKGKTIITIPKLS